MENGVRILLLEDNARDAELISGELSVMGMKFHLDHVSDRAAFTDILKSSPVDLILSDYSVPHFDGLAALAVAQEIAPEVPFIMVTGSIDEETAVSCMKAGAADYVLKDRLFQLSGSVRGVLESQRRRSEEKRAEMATALLAAIVEFSEDAIISRDLEGTILTWNGGAERIFGYLASEVVGRPIILLTPTELQQEEAQIIDRIKSGQRAHQFESTRITKDGRRIDVSVTISAVKDRSGKVIGASNIARDITDRKRAEEQVRASLREKEMLLKEVHHRVKNNLQVVSSLLRLQSHHTRNAEALAALKDCQERVRSMALVHEKIYRARDFSRVDFGEFLRELGPHLLNSFAPDHSSIHLEFDVEQVFLGMEAAIPCALIVNELVSNSLKHGFPDNRNGNVWIKLRLQPGKKIALTVQDDGVGFPADMELTGIETLGLQLVQTLTMQLKGTLRTLAGRGAGFTVLFSEAP